MSFPMESLNKTIDAIDAIEKRVDAIIEEAQRQKVAIIEARAVLKLQLTKPRDKIVTKNPVAIALGLYAFVTDVLDRLEKSMDEGNAALDKKLQEQKEQTEKMKQDMPERR